MFDEWGKGAKYWSVIDKCDGVSVDDKMHYFNVAKDFFGQKGENEKCFPVALFHDLVEDNYIGMDELTKLAHLTEDQVAALDAITRRKDEQYFDYIARLSKNEIARKVKLADLSDNIRRCAADLPNRWGVLRRYAKAYGILTDQWRDAK